MKKTKKTKTSFPIIEIIVPKKMSTKTLRMKVREEEIIEVDVAN
jgi:hypothetical protein